MPPASRKGGAYARAVQGFECGPPERGGSERATLCVHPFLLPKLRATGTPQNNWSVGKPIYDLEYADDTALMALSLEQLESSLHAVQVEATLYGL